MVNIEAIKYFYFMFPRNAIIVFISILFVESCFAFTENKGQLPEHVIATYNLGQTTYFIERDGITVDLKNVHDLRKYHLEKSDSLEIRGHNFKIEWLKCNENIKVHFENQKSGYLNWMVGDVEDYIPRILSYQKLILTNVWEGVDVVFYETESGIKYDYIVHPNSTGFNQIAIEYKHLTDAQIVDSSIHLQTECGSMVEKVPRLYSINPQTSIEQSVDFKLLFSDNVLTFDLQYDRTHKLVIDPELIVATYIGGSSVSQVDAVGVEGNFFPDGSFLGLSIIGGDSSTYPTTPGAYTISSLMVGGKAGVTRFSADGSEILWSTVIGSTVFNEFLVGSLISDEKIYLFFSVQNIGLPTTLPNLIPVEGGHYKLFAFVISEDGSTLLHSRALSSMYHSVAGQIGNGVGSPAFSVSSTTGSQGDLFLAFSARSGEVPITPDAFDSVNTADNPDNAIDAVVMKISSDLSELHWCTYFGGDHRDHGLSIIVDEDDKPIIAGTSFTTSMIPEINSDGILGLKYVGFIAKLSADGSEIVNGTYLHFPVDFLNGGGSARGEIIRFIDFDPDGNIWAYGYGANNNSDILITEGAYNNPTSRGFLCKFSPDLDELLVSTRIGFDPELRYAPTAFMIDNCGYIYTSANSAPPNDGETPGWINNAPLTDDALFDQGGFYLAVYEPDAAGLHYATLMGGDHTHGGRSKFDKKGVVYQAVCVPPFDTGFIPTDNAHATEQTFQFELGMFKIDFQSMAATAIMNIDQSEIGDCSPYQLNINNYSTPGEYTVLVNGEVTTFENDQITINEPGEYEIALVVYNPASCNTSDTTSVTLEFQDAPHVVADWEIELSDLCTAGGGTLSATFTGSGAESFNWQSWQGTSQDEDQLTLSFEEPGTYSLELTASESACNTSESLNFEFEYNPFIFDAQALIGDPCQLPVEFNASFTGQGSNTIEWLIDDLVVANDNSFENTFEQGNYTITLNASSENCGAESQQWEVTALGTVEATFSDEVDPILCEGDWLQLEASANQGSSQWWYNGEVTTGTTLSVNVQNNTHEALFVASDPNSCNLADSVLVSFEVVPAPTADFELLYTPQLCESELPVELIFAGQNAQSVEWHTGDGAVYTDPDIDHVFENSGLYTISVSAMAPPCEPASAQTELNVQLVSEDVYTLQFPNIITPNGDGINDCLFFLPQGSSSQTIADFSLRVFNRWGTLIYESNQVTARWCPQDLSSSTYIYLLTYTDLCNGETVHINRELVVSKRE